jgi:RNA polymerase sigma factor (sigma-70 family)
MPDPSLDTTQMRNWLDRMRGGDAAARDDLLRAVCNRLERLARKMLRRFPDIRRWADTGDVLQNALVRLLRALEGVVPDTTRHFFNLAAVQLRRELLDLARHYYGPRGIGTKHASLPPEPEDGDPCAAFVDDKAGVEDLERWTAFHEAVEGLPAEEREVVGLAFYHGWTHGQIAELFGVDERTVRRRWRTACLRLHEALEGHLPELSG